VNIRVSS